MIRMEIALILVLLFIACMYFSAERPHTLLHFRAAHNCDRASDL